MKKLFLIALLVLILVCINWLKESFAQTIPTSDQEINRRLILQKQSMSPAGSTSYASPTIFDPEPVNVPDSNMVADTGAPADIQPIEGQSATDRQLVLPQASQVRRFGQDLFENPQVGEVNTAQIPEEYRLGPGDNLIISLWGRVQQEWNLTVDRQGTVFIPKVGEVPAWGLTLSEFESRLDGHLNQVYTGYQKKVTLGKIRTIKVFVYGEVKSPGGYAISSLSSLFNALYAAGGPTANGSFRRIKLIRQSQTTMVDLYDFLLYGDKQCDLPLQSGDVVFVPLAGPQATVRGSVKRPAIYELVGGEKVSDLLTLAGGASAEAYLGRLMLDRIARNDAREVVDLDFTRPDKPDLSLADGDDLSVFSIYQMRQNVVWVNGQVKHPGTFERIDGMRVADLIDKGQLLPKNVYRDRADLYRHHDDGRVEIVAVKLDSVLAGNASYNVLLENLDSLYVYSTDDVERKKYVYIDGLVQRPGKYPLYERMTVSDLIFLAGNLTESAYMLSAELARIDSLGATAVLSVPLDRRPQGLDMPLAESDQLFIRKTPGYQLHRNVVIEGEITFPGTYSLTGKDETLYDLLTRAGGFTMKAYPNGIVFRRKAITADLERQDINTIVATAQPYVTDSSGNYKIVETMDLKPQTMERLVVDMDRLLPSRGAEGNIKLQTGDYIYIPQTPSGVTVMGEVCANGTIAYEPGKSVKYYLQQAGGFSKRADKGQTRLVKANGRVYASGGVLGRRADLGDVIVVPTEIKKDHDWLKYLTAGASILTGVATSVLIIDRL